MPLTNQKCKTAKPKAKSYKLFDEGGLYLEVAPSGRKYWRLKYRYLKKESRISLGIYPEITLAEVRVKRQEIRDELINGLHPNLIKLEKLNAAIISQTRTFELAATEWFNSRKEVWSPRYAATVKYRLEMLFPQLGSLPIEAITPEMFLACLQRIERTAPETARRVKNLASEVYIFAQVLSPGLINPSLNLEKRLKRYVKSHFASIELSDLPVLLKSLHEYRARGYPQTYFAIQLMLLTFVRTSELLEAKWNEFDLEKRLWTIPAERMKMRRSHLVPLSNQSIAILEELKNISGKREFVFPSIPRPRQPMSKGTILVALKRMGYSRKMTGHGFRALAVGILREKLRLPVHVVERQLAHVQKSNTAKAYDRTEYLEERTVMMQAYADYLELFN